MVKVIETNMIIGNYRRIFDFQSRVIEVESWEAIVKEIVDAESVSRNAVIGTMFGYTIPRNAKVENVDYDSNTLKCDVLNYAGERSQKLAYLISE